MVTESVVDILVFSSRRAQSGCSRKNTESLGLSSLLFFRSVVVQVNQLL